MGPVDIFALPDTALVLTRHRNSLIWLLSGLDEKVTGYHSFHGLSLGSWGRNRSFFAFCLACAVETQYTKKQNKNIMKLIGDESVYLLTSEVGEGGENPHTEIPVPRTSTCRGY